MIDRFDADLWHSQGSKENSHDARDASSFASHHISPFNETVIPAS